MPDNNYRIIKLENDNIENIISIEKSIKISDWSKSNIKSTINDKNYHYYGYFDTKLKTVLGYYCIRIVCDICELCNISVRKEHQNKGIGSILILHCIKIAKGFQCIRFELELRESNKHALKLYTAFDMKVVGKRKAYYDNPVENALLMTLELSPVK